MVTDQLVCPACDTHLKLRKALEPGKRIRCPKCGEVFAPGSETTFRSAAPEAVNPTIAWQDTSPHTVPEAPPVEAPGEARPVRCVKKKQGLPLLTIGLAAFLLLLIAG